ncbi:MAG TPA: DUF1800 domain-containing protein [Puia sp.]|jgi:uncharacterized protein (DUF1800 family)|nr:DUF1800 domain-containing protein [Puia sp.]
MVSSPPVTSGIKRYKGKWGPDQAAHLLKRTLFGVKKEDLDSFSKKSLKKAVRELIYTDYPFPDLPLNNYNDDKYTDPEIPAGETWVSSLKYDGMNNGRRKNSFKSWWMGLMIHQDRSIREKMVLFWHNHFVTESNTVDNALFCYQYNVLLRRHALGNFKEFVKAMTVEPAMLRYLNGYANTRKAPDENYGRELQELFTIGKGPGSHYTEEDVKAAARVLTGYTLQYKTFTSSFDPNRHDEGDKQFSAFYDHRLIKGIKGKEARAELDELLDMIFAREEVSRFICRKLYRFFVYHTIDETTEKNVIEPLATLFRKKDYEIRPVLEVLFESRHFFDPANYGSMIKSPLDFTVGLCREFDLIFPAGADYPDQYGFWEQIRNQAAGLQQNIGDPPNVAGWQAYYQEPEFDKLWISSDTLPRRNQFTDRMIGAGLSRKDKKLFIDPIAFASGLSNPEDPDQLIIDAVRALYRVELPAEQLRLIKTNILLSGLVGMTSDHYWTAAWLSCRDNPADKNNRTIVTTRLKALLKHLMDLPEYQLM